MQTSVYLSIGFIQPKSPRPLKLPSSKVQNATTPFVSFGHAVHSSSLELDHSKGIQSANNVDKQSTRVKNLPLGALLVENTTSAMRTRDKSILAKRDASTAVAAEICHDGASLVGLAGSAALGSGAGGRNLVLFARHVGSFVCWV